MPSGIYVGNKGRTPWNKGLKGAYVTSDETKAKLRAKRQGKKPTLGMTFGEETRRKHSETAKHMGLVPPSHKGVVRSPEVRQRMSEAQKKRAQGEDRKGEKAGNWRGGIAPKNRKIRYSTPHRSWVHLVLARDSKKCRNCGVSDVPLQVHHIKEFSKYPEFRFDINNGLTLCKPCHFAVHGRK